MKFLPDDMIPVDDAVDDAFSEVVVLQPMLTQKTGYRDAIVDTSRPVVTTRGIYDQGRGNVETSGSSLHKQVIVDTTLSIRWEPVRQCALRKGDRVFFPQRDEHYDVLWIYEEPGGRPDVHLARILEDA
jgi:hypothetical protein